MKAKTELLLHRLLWLAEKPMRPTFRNLEQSFEGWAYQKGLLAQIDRLEAQGLLEARQDPQSGERLHRLTVAGRLAANGGRDPETAWSTPWDRKWRLILFDIPENERSKRKKLTRALFSAGCGCLQGSVWIAPSTPAALDALFAEDDAQCGQLLLLLADSKGKSTDDQMVNSAWDFEAINDRYRAAIDFLDQFQNQTREPTRQELDEWTARENSIWRAAIDSDPLIPGELHPSGYLGRRAWNHRQSVLAQAAHLAAKLC